MLLIITSAVLYVEQLACSDKQMGLLCSLVVLILSRLPLTEIVSNRHIKLAQSRQQNLLLYRETMQEECSKLRGKKAMKHQRVF